MADECSRYSDIFQSFLGRRMWNELLELPLRVQGKTLSYVIGAARKSRRYWTVWKQPSWSITWTDSPTRTTDA